MINTLKQLYNDPEDRKGLRRKEEEEAAIAHSGFAFFLGKYLLYHLLKLWRLSYHFYIPFLLSPPPPHLNCPQLVLRR